MISYIVPENQNQRSILKLVSKLLPNYSYNQIEKLFRLQKVKINNTKAKKNQIVYKNDLIIIYTKEAKIVKPDINLAYIKVKFNILYEDSNILVVIKPRQTAMHSHKFSLDNQVHKYLNVKMDDIFKPAHIGRLDKDTTGIVIYAKNYQTALEMNKKQHFFVKRYVFKSDIDLKEKIDVKFWIKKNDDLKKMEVSQEKTKNSQLAITSLFLIGNNKIAQLQTGKKHQIRLTLSHLGYPIYGDQKYGSFKLMPMFLHCFFLQLNNLEGNLQYLNNKQFIDKPRWWE
ncbi:pseudouridine synthase family protein [Mesomycoplasma conjunctivae]|uniref:pseudouridine synthase family protein n=1 Tax=Mesomycoplasma conjunctivae TaxID=45361 RepID=UPI003DA3B42F